MASSGSVPGKGRIRASVKKMSQRVPENGRISVNTEKWYLPSHYREKVKRDRLCLGHKEQRSRKRVTHSHEEIEKEKKWQPKEKGKEWARKARLESKERVALLHYLKD